MIEECLREKEAWHRFHARLSAKHPSDPPLCARSSSVARAAITSERRARMDVSDRCNHNHSQCHRRSQVVHRTPGHSTLADQTRPLIGGQRIRSAPLGHTRSRVARTADAFRAGGPQTTTDQADSRYVLRPRVIDERRRREGQGRFVPVGRTRSRGRPAAGTFRARGSHTTTGQADSQYVPRPWPQAIMVARPAVRFAPAGHRRTQVTWAADAFRAGGSQMTTDQTDSRYVLRRWTIDERRPREGRGRCAPAGPKRPQDCRRKGPVFSRGLGILRLNP